MLDLPKWSGKAYSSIDDDGAMMDSGRGVLGDKHSREESGKGVKETSVSRE
jgi:hypothetical protein